MIPRQTTDDVLETLGSALSAWRNWEKPLAMGTDADQTLWDGDVGFDIYEALLAARGVRTEARDALAREATACGLDVPPDADPNDLAARLYDQFKAGKYDEERAFAMMAWVFAGWTEDEVGAFAEQTFNATGLPARIRAGMKALVAWAHARGLRVIVVSASPQVVVERAVRAFAIPPVDVMAMRPRVTAGVIQPEMGAPATYGHGKVLAVERALNIPSPADPSARRQLTLLAAFGDSAYDAAMLALAMHPVAVTPSPKLLDLCRTLPGAVELEDPSAPASLPIAPISPRGA
ncbi:HAD family hydrolase [Chondromyces apiculatus]|uniref:Hydrolase, haloacid dehalogenase-like family n=1 Tax=Chondromyces apiculatus DSM 436 TaxID=1192034 RepID=A0A017TAQ7_9BACT|nr:haloacid dehalogenase-like hydrolase [Chondromyces apiculatus]EYF05987.1 hydrolase, haloacid dehalogenase-like family [Chondromyces apiculatus DSM 436]